MLLPVYLEIQLADHEANFCVLTSLWTTWQETNWKMKQAPDKLYWHVC